MVPKLMEVVQHNVEQAANNNTNNNNNNNVEQAAKAKVELYQLQTANPDTDVESEMAAVRKRLGAAKLVKDIGTENFLDRRKYETEKQKLLQAGAIKDHEAATKRKTAEDKIHKRGKNWQNEN